MTKNAPNIPRFLLVFVLPPVLILIAAFTVLSVAPKLKPKPEKKEAQRILPTVEVIEARSSSATVEVSSQGTVQALTETSLVVEVSGRIEDISPALRAGGFFKTGDTLVEIDDVNYIANLATAKSRFADAQLAYEQELSLSEQARLDWEALGQGEAPSLALREPQLASAKANLEAAAAAVATAERDLERTRVKAPYDGRVREKLVDVGQMVNAGASALARIYSVDAAEVRLPVSLDDLSYISLPEAYSNTDDQTANPTVMLEADIGGQRYQWEGVIDRVEGAIDARTRLSYAIARVEEPYAKSTDNERPPLKVGLFVTARIAGEPLENAFTIPRKAVRPDDTLWLIDSDDRVIIQPIQIHKWNNQNVIVTGGLQDGDRICLTPLEYAIDGMQVVVETQVEAESLAAN